MQVVIFCGGQGTRLLDEAEVRPKPMVEIGGKPILWHIMKAYSHHGFHDFVLCLGYRGDIIRDYFLNYFERNSDVRVRLGENRVEHLDTFHDERQWSVLLAETGADTPTGGRLKRVARYLDGPRFMVTYGDGLADVDLKRLLAFHERSGRLATVTGIRPVTRFGELLVQDGIATEFREKAALREGWVNGGFFVMERAILGRISERSSLGGGSASSGDEVLESLAKDGQLAVFTHEGYWHAMDTPRDRRILEQEWSTGRAGWKVW